MNVNRAFATGSRAFYLAKAYAIAHRGAFIGLMVAIASLIMLLRNPPRLFDANLWAEDGWAWFPEAYVLGWRSLLLPHTGYLQSFSRLVALTAQNFPVLCAPTLFAVAALIVQLCPVALLLSRRLDSAWPNLVARSGLCVAYAGLPNSFEAFGNVTNSHWFLAMTTFLVLISKPPVVVGWRLVELGLLFLFGLSGPFCLLLAPTAFISWWRGTERHRLWRLVCVSFTCLIQGSLILTSWYGARPSGPLGANIVSFARIVSMQIEIGALLGQHVMSQVADTLLWKSDVFPLILGGITILIIAMAFLRGPSIFRLFAIFGGLMLAAVLVSPVVSMDQPAWVLLGQPGGGQRYFVVPMLVLIGAIFTLAGDRNKLLSGAGYGLAVLLLFGLVGDFAYPRLRPTAFNVKARAFASAPSGSSMEFPLHPPGIAPMILIKK